MEKIKILDLFSGTGSVSKAAALDPDLECFSLDISCKFSQPDLLIDIHEWDYRKVSRRRFDIIAAIVPCQMYSCAHTRAILPRDIPAANRNVARVLDMVKYFEPAVFWIENPTTGCLKSQDLVQHLKRIDVSYCMYSDRGYMKKTSLWTIPQMLADFKPKLCSHKTRCSTYLGGKHPNTFSGKLQLPIQIKYRIPENLLVDLLSCAKQEVINARDAECEL